MMTKEVMVETMEGLLHTPVLVLLVTMVDQTLPEMVAMMEMAMMPAAVAMIGEEARAHGCGPSERPPREPEIVKLLRQYLHASLQVRCVISVEAESEGGKKTIMFFKCWH
jgi:hypothetical protein